MDYSALYQTFNKNYPYGQMQTQSQIPFKPIAYERVSDIIGITYNLASMDNISVLPAPRQNEQQIFFITNDDKIYTRTAESGIGIVGYKQEYVQKLESELAEAQNQLYEIFDNVTKDNNTQALDTSSIEDRLDKLEKILTKFMEDTSNESKESTKNVGSISDLA